MHRRVVFQQLDDFQGYIRRFQAAAAALEDVRHVRLNAPVDIDKRPADDARRQLIVRRCTRRRLCFLLFLDAQRLLQIARRTEAVSDGGFNAELVFFLPAHDRRAQLLDLFQGCRALGFDFFLPPRYIDFYVRFCQVFRSDGFGGFRRVSRPARRLGRIAQFDVKIRKSALLWREIHGITRYRFSPAFLRHPPCCKSPVRAC